MTARCATLAPSSGNARGRARLLRLAVIARGDDTADLALPSESPSLLAVSLGLSATFPDDHHMPKHGLVVYDARDAWRRECQDEATIGRRRGDGE